MLRVLTVPGTSMSLSSVEPGQRLERRNSTSRKIEGGPKELTARYRLLIEYQIDGCPHRDLLQRLTTRRRAVISERTGAPEIVEGLPPEPGEPLTLEEAADLLRIRRRNARQLTKTRAYQTYMAAELQNFRDGEKARSLQTMVAVRDDPGLGKAADRKVRLTAAQMLIGETDANRSGTTVNVFNGGQQLTAGIVICDTRTQPIGKPPLEHASHTIEHGGSKDA